MKVYSICGRYFAIYHNERGGYMGTGGSFIAAISDCMLNMWCDSEDADALVCGAALYELN